MTDEELEKEINMSIAYVKYLFETLCSDKIKDREFKESILSQFNFTTESIAERINGEIDKNNI